MKLLVENVRRMPERALAVQYKGGESHGLALLVWAAGHGFPGGHFRDGLDGGAVFFAVYPKVHRALIGDWVVIGEDHGLSVLTDLEFSMKWERPQ